MTSESIGATTFTGRLVIVSLLTVVSIVVHEWGHWLVYALAGIPVHVTLQSVRPVGAIDPRLDRWALVAGPALSLVVAAVCLAVARQRHSFFWATASFTNASIRLFPLAMDFLRATRGAPAFSDEGTVAMALGSASWARVCLLTIPIGLSLLLTVLSAREYHFANRVALRVIAIYLFSLLIGVGVVIADEILS